MTLRIATRQSPLALWQAQFVRDQLQAQFPNEKIECIPIVTHGDRDLTQPLANIGGKGLFVKALQQALLNNEADIAVHCVKDMSVHDHPDLTLASILKREAASDAFISPLYDSLDACPPNSVIGTASPRRHSLIKHYYPQLETALLRGNVNSRLDKCEKGEFAGILLATAGLKRLGMLDVIKQTLPIAQFIPAIGQGALAIECRADRADLIEQMQCLNDMTTAYCVLAERSVNRVLGGDCYTPVGAHATINHDTLTLHAFVGSHDGKKHIHAEHAGKMTNAEQIGQRVAEALLSQGAKLLLEQTI